MQWTLTLFIVGLGLGFILNAREHVMRPLQTMTNLLAALREGDYSIRARGARADDALGEALLEINALGETLRLQRLGAFEATALLRTIMAEIDVAVFTSIRIAGPAKSRRRRFRPAHGQAPAGARRISTRGLPDADQTRR
jgi:hypothetical protein